MSDPAERFADLLRARLGSGPSRGTLAAQRLGLIAGLRRPREARSLPRGLAVAAALTVGTASIVIGVRAWHARLAPYATWAGHTIYGKAGFEAPATEQSALDFSDGSQVLLEPSTHASLGRFTTERAELTLDSGRLRAHIRKHTGITWTIAAGPYRVRVVGTQFSVDWRDGHAFRVDVREGLVRVSGGDLGTPGVDLGAGAHLERDLPKALVVSSHSVADERVTSAAARPASPELAEPASNEAASSAPAAQVGEAQAGPPRTAAGPAQTEGSAPWQALAKRGRYRAALARAEGVGFERVLAEASSDDLLLLASAARYSGDAERAHSAQLRLRERFPGSPAAALAAFYLARSAFDSGGRTGEAAHWFRVYLREAPTGALAPSARFNLMSILLNSGDTNGARAVAEDYLRYHPDGPHAVQARTLLARARP